MTTASAGIPMKNSLPNNPLIALTPISVPTFGLNAVGICSSVKTEKLAM
jgi:hypothetical protein